jgi:hypothetical protein
MLWRHVVAIQSEAMIVFLNLNLVGDGTRAVCLVAVDRRHSLYWQSTHTVNLHPVSTNKPSLHRSCHYHVYRRG